jgi:Nif-specific regulatory protein
MPEGSHHPSSSQLEALLSTSRLLTSNTDLDSLLEQVVRAVMDLFSCEASTLFLVDPSTGELVFQVATGPVGEHLRRLRMQAGEGIAGWVAQQGQPALVNDLAHDSRFSRAVDTKTGFRTRSILAVPLLDQGCALGVLQVLNTSKTKQFVQDDIDLLTIFAAHSAVALRNAQAFRAMRNENQLLHASLNERYRTLIVESPAMREVVALAQRAARSHATVLLLGESGVGKEIFARSIHTWSDRASRPFMAINCVALSDHLLESELFGHEKGSFTGAHQQKKGLLELAQGGTVFLDEIGDMKPELQAKLLRVLQDREFERVGGSHPIKVDIRIIAATNQDLAAAVQAGRFRKDLYFRLNVVTITLPPLRDRPEDVPVLAEFFAARYSKEMKRASAMRISDAAMRLLQAHGWPGNVRELENVIERAVVLTVGHVIEPKDLALEAPPSNEEPGETLWVMPFHASVEGFKRMRLQQALLKAGGNRAKAAQQLQLQPTYLSRLCKQMGIP